MLFDVDTQWVHEDLGTAWRRIDSAAVGASSNPHVYLQWSENLVVGLDDRYINVFRTDADGEVIDAYSDGVIWEGEWSERGNDYADLVRVLWQSVGREGLPSWRSRRGDLS